MLCGPPARNDDITCASGDVIDSFDLGGDTAPIIGGVPGNISVGLGREVILDVNAFDPNGDPIDALTADLGTLPLDDDELFTAAPDHRTGRFTWTPDAADVGQHTVTFKASNALTGMATMVVDVQTVLGAPAAGPLALALEAVRPNPAAFALTLSYSIADGEAPRLELVDVAGRVVQRLDQAPLGPGRHVTSWSKPAGLPPGIYWLRLRQAGRTLTRSVVFR